MPFPYRSRPDFPLHLSEKASCTPAGHDGIVATALILAKILAKEKEQFPVKVRFLFEPAEEIGEGAKRMLSAGALEPKPGCLSDVPLCSGYALWNGGS